ncbi:MAG TPA: hypothetical protein VNZ53_21060 [Steroidobacteraceae bacterium]|nr:hypothetical protein [Steroidobacteraceae bacterium]
MRVCILVFLSVNDRHVAGEASAMTAAGVLSRIWRRVTGLTVIGTPRQ